MPPEPIIISLWALDGMQFGISVLTFEIVVVIIIWVYNKIPFT